MGVHGLWKLLDPAGQRVSLETLENKVLAVDVSIWLHQLTKGMHGIGGGIAANAHLIGLFNRICKLLYYRIKPVFVFDGSVPRLKKDTIEARKRQKRKARDTSDQLREELLKNYLERKAIGKCLNLGENLYLPSTSGNKKLPDDLFILPPLNQQDECLAKTADDEDEVDVSTVKVRSRLEYELGMDLHSINVNSANFKALPAEMRHDILTELQETRKQSSWGHLKEMPEDSNEFSSFQMKRLLKRRNFQVSLEQAEKEIGGKTMSLGQLERMFKEDGIVVDSLPSQRIASDSVTRILYVCGDNSNREKEEIPKHPRLPEPVPVASTSAEMREEFDSDMDSPPDEIPADQNEVEAAKLSSLESLSQEQILRLITEGPPPAQTVKDISKNVLSERALEKMEPVVESISLKNDVKVKGMEKTGIAIIGSQVIEKSLQDREAEETTLNVQESIRQVDFSTDFHYEDSDNSDKEFVELSKSDYFKINRDETFSNETIIKGMHSNEKSYPELSPSRIENEVANCTKSKSELNEDFPKKRVLRAIPEKDVAQEKPSCDYDSDEVDALISEVSEGDWQGLSERKDLLETQEKELLYEQAKQDKLGITITQQMIIEAQELLRLFGLPYVVAPMEAEAQCAYLNDILLTEGTITDDSDIWLFGGKKVYKNFFDNNKNVLQFSSGDIERYFKLSREDLIELAMFVGSDYTVGIDGVGPVKALEIIAYLRSNEKEEKDIVRMLTRFKDIVTNDEKLSSFAKKMKGIKLTSDFPNESVIRAYMKPEVDESRESFTWAAPKLDSLRHYARNKFGWKLSKINEILHPVMKRLMDSSKQTRIDSYFKSVTSNHSVELSLVSKRVQHAVNSMKNSKEQKLPAKKLVLDNSPRKRAKLASNCFMDGNKCAKRLNVSKEKKAFEAYFGVSAEKKVIPQLRAGREESARRREEAVKIFNNGKDKGKRAKKKVPVPVQKDVSYLSESSSD